MATFYTCGRPECLRVATVAQQEVDRLRTALEQAECERDEARGLYWKAVRILRYMHNFPNAPKVHEAAVKMLPSDDEIDDDLRGESE